MASRYRPFVLRQQIVPEKLVGGFSNDISNKGYKAHFWMYLQTNFITFSKMLICFESLNLKAFTNHIFKV